MWEYLVKLHTEDEITLVITTHYMDEAEGLCDRLAIVDRGRIVALGTPQELKHRAMGGDVVEAEFSNLPDLALKALEKSEFVLNVSGHENSIVLLVKNGAEAVPRIVELVNANGGRLRTIALREPTLNDVFLHFTGRGLVD